MSTSFDSGSLSFDQVPRRYSGSVSVLILSLGNEGTDHEYRGVTGEEKIWRGRLPGRDNRDRSRVGLLPRRTFGQVASRSRYETESETRRPRRSGVCGKGTEDGGADTTGDPRLERQRVPREVEGPPPRGPCPLRTNSGKGTVMDPLKVK